MEPFIHADVQPGAAPVAGAWMWREWDWVAACVAAGQASGVHPQAEFLGNLGSPSGPSALMGEAGTIEGARHFPGPQGQPQAPLGSDSHPSRPTREGDITWLRLKKLFPQEQCTDSQPLSPQG